MNKIAVIANEGGTHLPESRVTRMDHTSDLFTRTNRAAHISALGIFLRNFPLDVFDESERSWFLAFESRVCRMEAEAFDDLGLE